MQFQYKAACEAGHPHLLPLMDERDVRQWYFLVVNLPRPYAGGEYIFRLTAKETFPHDPPSFEFITKNGVFSPGGKVCISIGEFHANSAAGETGAYGWRPSLGMLGFAREVVNGLIDPDHLGGGIRVRNDPPAKKAKLAAASAAYNWDAHGPLMARFLRFADDHPRHKAVRLWRMWKAAARAAELGGGAAFASEPPPRLRALLAAAFDFGGWARLAPIFDHLVSGPEGVRRAVLLRVAEPLREALEERELPVRGVLVCALCALVCCEGAGAGARAAAAAPEKASDGPRAGWLGRYEAALGELAAVLPGVCGSASAETVPSAVRGLLGGRPAAFAAIHPDLARFLRTQDIDKKARLGGDLVATIRRRAAPPVPPPVAACTPPPPVATEREEAEAAAREQESAEAAVRGEEDAEAARPPPPAAAGTQKKAAGGAMPGARAEEGADASDPASPMTPPPPRPDLGAARLVEDRAGREPLAAAADPPPALRHGVVGEGSEGASEEGTGEGGAEELTYEEFIAWLTCGAQAQ
jgi:ubiquitin-protein ligase